MHGREASHGSRGLVWSAIGLLVTLLLAQAGMVSAASLKSRMWKGTSLRGPAAAGLIRGVQQPAEAAGAADFAAPSISSSATKLFWFDPGPFNTSSNSNAVNGTLWFVDPSVVPPVPTVYQTGVTVFLSEWDGDMESHFIVTGDIDLGTYHLTNLKIGYLFYFKDGKIWLVDTSADPLASRQLSNEDNATAETLCSVNSATDLTNSDNSEIHYVLAGTDGICRTGDDLSKLVRLDATETTTPMDLPWSWVDEALFGNRYVVMDYSTYPDPFKVKMWDSGAWKNIGTFTDYAYVARYDNSRIILVMDGILKRYALPNGPLATLYTPGSNEEISDIALDNDGSVYFLCLQRSTPAKNTLKKKPGAGGTVKLATFSTPTPLLVDAAGTNLELSPTYAVYSFTDPTCSALTIRSVPKAGGASVTLSTNAVDGGVVGNWLLTETTQGQMQRLNLDGSGKITLKDAQLNGATFGGAADWYYRFDPATFRGLVSTKNRNLKSYLVSEDFTDPLQGILLGAIPYNLSNLGMYTLSNQLLGLGEKRNGWISSGSDVVFVDAAAPMSFSRLTNSSSRKMVHFE